MSFSTVLTVPIYWEHCQVDQLLSASCESDNALACRATFEVGGIAHLFCAILSGAAYLAYDHIPKSSSRN